MRIPGFIDKRAVQRGRRLWLHYGVFWLGAIATGLVAVLYAKLIDVGYDTFLRYATRYWWLPLPVSPAIGALGVWLTRRFSLDQKAAESLRSSRRFMTAALLRHAF